MTLADYLAARANLVERALDHLVPAGGERPATIHRAMRHSLFAGGKRIRPILCIAAAEAVLGREISDGDADDDGAAGLIATACTLELIHTYSLIHDDLPALDNDDLRRGRPTCHKVFGEAMAILAGDALLTRAFQVLAELEGPPPRTQVRLAAELSRAAGTVEGMIGGQVADLEAEGREIDGDELHYIHRSKTGVLIQASVRMGAVYADADEEDFEALGNHGREIGFAFQIVDDILDVTQTSEALGKTAGKDADQQKATFPALYGLEASRRRAEEHFAEACRRLERFGDRARRLREIAERIVHRTS